jgi:hypothetical protein
MLRAPSCTEAKGRSDSGVGCTRAHVGVPGPSSTSRSAARGLRGGGGRLRPEPAPGSLDAAATVLSACCRRLRPTAPRRPAHTKRDRQLLRLLMWPGLLRFGEIGADVAEANVAHAAAHHARDADGRAQAQRRRCCHPELGTASKRPARNPAGKSQAPLPWRTDAVARRHSHHGGRQPRYRWPAWASDRAPANTVAGRIYH